MDFQLSEDQRLLRDSVERLVSERYDLRRRALYGREARGWSEANWQAIVELGLPRLPFSEACGGLALGGVELMIVGEAFGRGLVIEPYLPSVVLAGAAIARGAGDRSAQLLAPILSGEKIAALADRCRITLANGQLHGAATVVLGGDSADMFVIPEGAGAWIVRADADRLSVRGYSLHGGGRAADLKLDGVSVVDAERLSDGSVQFAVESGIAFLAAEASGAMRAALDLTVEHLKTRQQFGRPLGANQALQHKAAEMLVEVEQAHSAAIYAAALFDSRDAAERAKGMAAIKAFIGNASRLVAQNAVQLHGGMGVSEDHIVSHYFRRLTAIGMLLGEAEAHIRSLAECGGFVDPGDHLAA